MRYIIISVLLVCTLNVKSQQVLLQENFDPPSFADSISNLGGWNVTDTLFPGSYYFKSKVINNQTNRFETGILPIPTLSGDYIILEFDHFCKIDFWDFARISLTLYNSPNSPDTFLYRLPDTCYFGNANYAGLGGRFVSNSYNILWQPVNPAATPQPSWWRHEIFYLNYGTNLFNIEQFFNLQFYLKDGGSHGLTPDFGWAVDNFKLSVGPFSGITDLNSSNCIVFPNPVTNILNLGKYFDQIRIFSVNGSLTGQYRHINKIDLSNYKSGIYFVEIDKVGRFKIIKN